MGPLPMYSVICWKGSVLAIRSGMMKAIGVLFLPSANSILGYGADSTHLTVRSSTATSSFCKALSISPMESRDVQRVRLVTTSLASTGSPSWNLRPGRSLKVQVRPSLETSSPSTICRCGSSLSLRP